MKLTTQERQILATVALSHAPECDCETVCRRLREDDEHPHCHGEFHRSAAEVTE